MLRRPIQSAVAWGQGRGSLSRAAAGVRPGPQAPDAADGRVMDGWRGSKAHLRPGPGRRTDRVGLESAAGGEGALPVALGRGSESED